MGGKSYETDERGKSQETGVRGKSYETGEWIFLDLHSPGDMFACQLVAEKEPDVDDADEDNVALPGNRLRLRPNKPDLKNRFCYDRNGHDNVEVGESGIFSLNIVFFWKL